jgi:hypothetical protein
MSHFGALERGKPDHDIDFIQEIALRQFVEPDFHSVGIIDKIGLEELSPGIDFFMLPDCLEFWIRGKGRSSCTQEEFRRELELPAVKVMTFIAHAPQYPYHLDGIHVVDVHATSR